MIEVDGSIHELEDVKSNDQRREDHLNELGLIVVRFTNQEVFNKMEKVLQTINTYIKNTKG